MSFRGRVQGGAVVLDPPAELPEGAAVEVVVVSDPGPLRELAVPTLAQRYAAVIGIVVGPPSDFGTTHEHQVSTVARPPHE